VWYFVYDWDVVVDLYGFGLDFVCCASRVDDVVCLGGCG